MKVVLDTNTVVSAIAWEALPRQILLALREGRHTFVTSAALLAELTSVLQYPKLKALAAHPFLPIVLEWLFRPEHVVTPDERLSVINADPADNIVLEAAVAGKADVIVSGDRHLLDLGEFQNIKILTAREFAVRHLKGSAFDLPTGSSI